MRQKFIAGLCCWLQLSPWGWQVWRRTPRPKRRQGSTLQLWCRIQARKAVAPESRNPRAIPTPTTKESTKQLAIPARVWDPCLTPGLAPIVIRTRQRRRQPIHRTARRAPRRKWQLRESHHSDQRWRQQRRRQHLAHGDHRHGRTRNGHQWRHVHRLRSSGQQNHPPLQRFPASRYRDRRWHRASRPARHGQQAAHRPAVGLRMRPRFMHDLRWLSLQNAIERHAGEAEHVRQRFQELSPVEKQPLFSFLNSCNSYIPG